MNYLRIVRVEHVWEYAGIDWRKGLPSGGAKGAPVWTLATPVRDADVEVSASKFYKSVRAECNDSGKKGSLLTMLNELNYAIRYEDYQGFLKNSKVGVKEAHGFTFDSQKQKLWELKFQNKDRVYFFTHHPPEMVGVGLLVPLLFHHKKDQTTPVNISSSCEKIMRQFLDSRAQIEILKE